MSILSFIVDLADELTTINPSLGTSGENDDLGMYPHEVQHRQLHQQQLPQPRRQRVTPPQMCCAQNIKQRHHPYCRNKFVNAADYEKEVVAGNANDREVPTTSGRSGNFVVGKKGFQITLNVKAFDHKELSVRTVGNCVIVEGEHGDKDDGYGVISRHFVRKYNLPKGYDGRKVYPTLTADGVLKVLAIPQGKIEEPLERVINIQQTGQIHMTAKKFARKDMSKIEVVQPQQQPKEKPKQQEMQESAESNGDTKFNENRNENELESADSAMQPVSILIPKVGTSNAAGAVDESNDGTNTNDNAIVGIPVIIPGNTPTEVAVDMDTVPEEAIGTIVGEDAVAGVAITIVGKPVAQKLGIAAKATADDLNADDEDAIN